MFVPDPTAHCRSPTEAHAKTDTDISRHKDNIHQCGQAKWSFATVDLDPAQLRRIDRSSQTICQLTRKQELGDSLCC